MRKGFIYSLNCPITGIPKYIGKTITSLKARLASHLSDKKNNKRTNWIKSLKKKGLKPTITIIDEFYEDDLYYWEIFYISLFKQWGFILKNGDNGGYGRDKNYKHSKETIEKIRISNKGKIISEETRKKQSLARIGKIAPMKGIKKTKEQIEKLRLVHIGRKQSDEEKLKRSLSMKGRPSNNKGIPMSDEAKAKQKISFLRKRIKKKLFK